MWNTNDRQYFIRCVSFSSKLSSKSQSLGTILIYTFLCIWLLFHSELISILMCWKSIYFQVYLKTLKKLQCQCAVIKEYVKYIKYIYEIYEYIKLMLGEGSLEETDSHAPTRVHSFCTFTIMCSLFPTSLHLPITTVFIYFLVSVHDVQTWWSSNSFLEPGMIPALGCKPMLILLKCNFCFLDNTNLN